MSVIGEADVEFVGRQYELGSKGTTLHNLWFCEGEEEVFSDAGDDDDFDDNVDRSTVMLDPEEGCDSNFFEKED